MIIKSYEIEKLKLTNSNIHLIYGNNEGIKEDIINEIYLKKFDGDLLKYEEQEILNQKDEFVSGLFTKSLFENKKLIIISRVTDKFIDILSDILEKELLDTKIIIKSSSLEKKSKIRSVFEKGKNILCTPVYEDDSRSLNYVIQTYLRENKLSISQEIKNLLIDRSNGDRINLINELCKLKNLSLTRKILTSEDAKKLSNLTENYSVFELSDNYLAKNSKKVSNILNENNYSPEDCMLIIRTMLNKSKRLLKIKTSMDEDVNLDQVISNFKPPIFWKEKDIVKKQAQSWSTSEVKELIFKINGLEALVKKNSANSVIFVSNFISNY
tara:strand:+ start:478 stop:1455 length:978 start_codon:yes stop_codon:yes gene_type:complete